MTATPPIAAPTGGTIALKDGTQLDAGVVKVMRAIRQVESDGDFNATGDNGTSLGAYQWNNGKTKLAPGQLPANFKSAATQYGLDPNDFSPANQNKVAYAQINAWKSQGKTPNEIDALWNGAHVDKATGKYVHNNADRLTTFQKALAAQIGVPTAQASTEAPPAPTPSQTADTAAADDSGALFPSATGDSALVAGAKAAGNTIPSAFKFAGGVLNTFNPLHIAETIGQIPGAFSALAAQRGGAAQAVGAAAAAAPETALDMFVPKGAREAASGAAGMATGDKIGHAADLEAAQRDVVNDPFGTVAPLAFGARAAAGGIDAASAALSKARMAGYVDNIVENTKNGVPIPRSTGTDIGGTLDRGVSTIAKPVIGAVKSTFGKAGDIARGGEKLTPEDYAGEILQGDTALRGVGAKVLGKLDTKGARKVESYEDLSQRLGSAIEQNQGKVDAEYAKDTTPVKLLDLTQRSKGIAPINYVSEALNGLGEFYTKARDVQSAAWAKGMLSKAKSVGLTPSEINLIAKKYGSEFGDKAFSKVTREPLTSVNAQAYENIRSGLKSTARGLLKDDTARTLDKNTSDMIRVKEAADKVREKVNGLDQRISQRGLFEKAGRALGIVVDTATGGLLRGFVQKVLLDSNRGNKSFNSLNLEERLGSNLKRLQYLEKVNDSTLLRIVTDALRNANALPESDTRPARAVKAATVFGRQPANVGQ